MGEKIKSSFLKKTVESKVVISASPEFLLKPICEKININYLIASRVDIKTGVLLGKNCYGKEKVKKTIKNDKKIGRNDLCPCGSGKKYKNCCGK